MTIPYSFANASGTLPLIELDANFESVYQYVLTAGNVVNNAQANITSVGLLNSVSVSGNVSAAGNITGAYYFGNGVFLTGMYGNSDVANYLPVNPTILTIENGLIAVNANVANTNANVSALSNTVANLSAGTSNIDLALANTNANVANTNSNVANLVISLANTDSNVANTNSNVANLTLSLANTNSNIANTDSNVANLTSSLANTSGNVANLTISLANTNSNVANVYTSLTGVNSVLGNAVANITTLQGQVYNNSNVTTFLANTSIPISTTGNISATFFYGDGSQLSNISTYSNSNVINLLANFSNNSISTAGNITAGIFNGGLQFNANSISSTSNTLNLTANEVVISHNLQVLGTTTTVNVANVNVSNAVIVVSEGALSPSQANSSGIQVAANNYASFVWTNITNTWLATGNLSVAGNVAGNVFIGDGSGLTNINAGNIAGAYGNANVANYLPTYTGNLSISHLSVANDAVIYGNLSVAGNITYQDSNAISTDNLFAQLANNTANIGEVNGAGLVVGQGNLVTFVYSVPGNEWTTNVGLSVTGNVAGNVFIGDGSGLTNINAGNIAGAYSNANVEAYLPSSNVIIAINSNVANTNSNVANISNSVTSLSGNVYANANVEAYLPTSNVIIAINSNVANISNAVTSLSGNVYANANVEAYLPTSNVIISINSNVSNTNSNVANISNAVTSLSGNVYNNTNVAVFMADFGNNSISTSGNITGNYILGNGAYLTGLPAGYSNTDAASYFASGNSSSNISITGNVLTTSDVSATGNVTASNFTTSGPQGNITGANVVSATTFTATGNVYAGALYGDGYNISNINAGNIIGSYGNSNVEAYLPTSNVIISINSNVANTNSNVANISNAVTSLSGNVYANANVVVLMADFGNNSISTTGNITGGYLLGNGAFISGLPAGYSNADAANYFASGNSSSNISITGNVLTTGNVSATGNVYAGSLYGDGYNISNINAGNIVGSYGNSNVEAYLPTSNVIISINSNIANTNGNVANISNAVTSLSGNVYANANVEAYLPTSNVIIAINSNVANTNSNVANVSNAVTSLSGNVYANANVAVFMADFGNNSISTSGNVNANFFIGDGSQLTNINAGNITGSYGNANVEAYLPSSNVIIAINSNVANTNNNVANISNAVTSLSGNVYANANVEAYLPSSNVIISTNSNVANTNSNVANISNAVTSLSGNVYANANVAAYLPTYTGNLTGADLSISNNAIIYGNLSVAGNITYQDSNAISTDNLFVQLANNTANIGEVNGAGLVVGQGNLVTFVYSVPGNAWHSDVGFSAAGNIVGNVFIGNGSGLSNINADNIVGSYGNSNVEAYLPTSNIIIGINSNVANTNSNVSNNASNITTLQGNVANLTTDLGNTNSNVSNNASNITTLQGNVTSLFGLVYNNTNVSNFMASFGSNSISTTGNITGGYLLGNGAFISGLPAGYSNTDAASYFASGNSSSNISITGNVLTTGNVSATGNVTAANFTTSGPQGNITGANVVSAATFTATGNVYAGALYGDGYNISNINAGNIVGTYGNSNVATFLADFGNNIISTTGNVTGGNILTSGLVSVTGNGTFGNVTGTIFSATGNVVAGNLIATSLISATGNVSGDFVIAASEFLSPAVVIRSTTANAGIELHTNGTGNINVNTNYVNNLKDPLQAQDAATKYYVDSVVQGLDPKASVHAATTANLSAYTYNNGTSGVGATLTAQSVGNLVVDGQQILFGERVLVKNETGAYVNPTTESAAFNGIYLCTTQGTTGAAWVLTRASDFDVNTEMYGAFTFVETGSSNADTGWTCTNNANAPITIGTTQIIWSQFSGAGTYTAGNALSLNGSQFNVNVDSSANTTIAVNGSNQLYIPPNAVLTTPNIDGAIGTSLSVTGQINSGNLSSAGNVTAGNVLTGGLISATGNIVGGNLRTAGNASVTGTVNVGTSVTVDGGAYGNVVTTQFASVFASGAGPNPYSIMQVRSSDGASGLGMQAFTGSGTLYGNTAINFGLATIRDKDVPSNLVIKANIDSTGLNVTGVVSATGNVTGGNLATAGVVSATGDVTAGNILTAGIMSSTGNVTSGNVLTSGSVSATGNVSAANFYGNAYTLALVANTTTGNIPTLNSTGNIVDSAKIFDDTIVTNDNYWSANQTSSYVITQLLNVPDLPPVNIATTANVTKSGLAAIDGVTPTATTLVLVKNQTNNDNGVWLAQSGAWVRQAYVANVYANVTTQTTYGNLNINSGVVNVLSGTTNKNLQFQITVANPAATFGNSIVYVTSTTKIPIAGPNNRFVDISSGNDTNNNGSSAFPFATISRALTSAQYPLTITVAASGGNATSAITWLSTNQNSLVQSQYGANDGGQTQLTGVQTFATGSTRNDFKATTHATGSSAPFVFQSGAAMRNYFEDMIVNTTAASWITMDAGVRNWITLDNINVTNFNSIELPAFTTAFTVYVANQTNILIFSGTGAANTVINIQDSLEGATRVGGSFLGTITWNGAAFGARIGSSNIPNGIITDQSTLTTVLAWITDATYDGYYLISGFTPTSFQNGAIIGKQTVSGVATSTWYARTADQAPSVITNLAGGTYVNGSVNAVGNVLAGGLISAVGNIQSNGYILGNGALLTGVITSVANINNGTSNVTVVAANANITVGVDGTANIAVFANTGAYVTGVVSVSGNATAGNILTSGQASATGNVYGNNIYAVTDVSAAGNITGNYFIGNGSLLTGIAGGGGTSIANGTSNVTVVAANANVSVGVDGTANIAVFANTGAFVTGVVSATGNVTGNFILGNGSQLTGIITSVSNVVNGSSNLDIGSANANVTISVSTVGNVAVFTPTGVSVAGTTQTSGNITAGNILTAGVVSSTGNISGNIFIGNAATTSTTANGLGYVGMPVNSQAGNSSYTLALTDQGRLIYANSAITLNIPTNANVVFPPGSTVAVAQHLAGTMTIVPATGVTLVFVGTSQSGTRSLSTNGMASLTQVNTNVWFITGTGIS